MEQAIAMKRSINQATLFCYGKINEYMIYKMYYTTPV